MGLTSPALGTSDGREERALRLFLRSRWDPAVVEEAHALASSADLDWSALCDLALAENVGPLLYSVSRAHNWPPPSVREVLLRAHRGTVLRNTFLFQQLEDVLQQLAANQVEVILLKGAGLCCTLYGSTGSRPMVDLDLLVQKADVLTSIEELGVLGYKPLRLETHTGMNMVYENEVALSKPGAVTTQIEVHWNLFDSPHYHHQALVDWLWQTAIPTKVGDAEAWVLAPEAQLLHLCGHLALHHLGHGLMWHHDIAETIAHDGERINWDDVLARARRYDLILSLQTVLPRVALDWRAPVPPGVLASLGEMRPSAEERSVYSQFTAENRPTAQHFWADLGSMKGWRRRLLYALSNLVPSPAYMRHRYGFRQPLLLPLYYLYRYVLGLRSLLRWLLAW